MDSRGDKKSQSNQCRKQRELAIILTTLKNRIENLILLLFSDFDDKKVVNPYSIR